METTFSHIVAGTKRAGWDTARPTKAKIKETHRKEAQTTTAKQSGTTQGTTSSLRRTRRASKRPLGQGTARANRVSTISRITDVQMQTTVVSLVEAHSNPRQLPQASWREGNKTTLPVTWLSRLRPKSCR